MEKIITCTAPVNIAVIKYWGKRDEELVLPLNDSISFTLSQKEMCTTTTVVLSPNFHEDRLWLNDKEEDINNPRIQNCLKELRRRSSKRKSDADVPPFVSWHTHICSRNNFPTAAGLASSAAGYACLVFALGKLLEVEEDLSPIARLGSGSACRSLYGGLVRWHKGESADGSDSVAKQIGSADLWPDLHVIICVANAGRKKTSSTEGMQRSAKTSYLLQCRIKDSVVRRTEQLLQAVDEKDWSTFCDLAMADSNEMHAVCLATSPPCVYMNDTSHAISSLVHRYNQVKEDQNLKEDKICYTFDAGPNACLFVPGRCVRDVSALLNQCFPLCKSTNSPHAKYWQGIPTDTSVVVEEELMPLLKQCEQPSHTIKFFLHTRVGVGPRVLSDEDDPHLLDRSTGLPLDGESFLLEPRNGVPTPAS